MAPWCPAELKEPIGHLGLYGILGFFTARWVAGKAAFGSIAVLVVTATVCGLWGIFDELHQMFVITRSSSVHDVGLDLLGGTLGAVTHCTMLGLLQLRSRPANQPSRSVDGRGGLELAALKTGIPVKEFMIDFQLGMTDTELIDKYEISPNQLRSIFKRLLDRQLIDAVAFEAWQIFGNADVPLDIRKHPRIALENRPPVHEEGNPENSGVILNISKHGLAVVGLRARVDDMITLVVPRTVLTPFGPIRLDVRCRWSKTDEGCEGFVSGFYVVIAGETDWDSICRLFASYSSVPGRV